MELIRPTVLVETILHFENKMAYGMKRVYGNHTCRQFKNLCMFYLKYAAVVDTCK